MSMVMVILMVMVTVVVTVWWRMTWTATPREPAAAASWSWSWQTISDLLGIEIISHCCLQILTEKCRFVAEHCSANKQDDCFQIHRVFSFWTHFVSFLRGEKQFNLRGNGGKQLSTVGQLDILLLTFALFTFCHFWKNRATSHNGFLPPDSLICMISW